MEFKDRVKVVLTDAAINFLRGAANGFAFTTGSQLAKVVLEHFKSKPKCEKKCNSGISVKTKI